MKYLLYIIGFILAILIITIRLLVYYIILIIYHFNFNPTFPNLNYEYGTWTFMDELKEGLYLIWEAKESLINEFKTK